MSLFLPLNATDCSGKLLVAAHGAGPYGGVGTLMRRRARGRAHRRNSPTAAPVFTANPATVPVIRSSRRRKGFPSRLKAMSSEAIRHWSGRPRLSPTCAGGVGGIHRRGSVRVWRRLFAIALVPPVETRVCARNSGQAARSRSGAEPLCFAAIGNQGARRPKHEAIQPRSIIRRKKADTAIRFCCRYFAEPAL
jgi:hypothetical protein